jgi:hypothetical protein
MGLFDRLLREIEEVEDSDVLRVLVEGAERYSHVAKNSSVF